MTNDYTDDGAASGADDGTDNTVITGEEVWGGRLIKVVMYEGDSRWMKAPMVY